MAKKRNGESGGAGWTSGFVGRLEVPTDRSGRRRWSAEVKGRLVRESLAPGATVSGVARRHGLMPQQLTRWRRLARQGRLALPEAPETAGADSAGAFAALVVAEDPPPSPATAAEGSIELVVGPVVVRLPATIPAVRIAEIAAALETRR